MTEFVTSDIHFGHKNIMSFCPVSRPFADVDHMHEVIIEKWNKTVRPNDRTYILGDVAFCNAQEAVKLIKCLNGSKVLIQGNHDSKLVKDASFRECFESIHEYYSTSLNKVKIVMLHYPIAEWDQMHRGAVHLFGHLHGGATGLGLEKYRCMDVGMDTNYCTPYKLEDVVTELLKRPIRSHHQKGE